MDINIVYRNPQFHLANDVVYFEIWEWRIYGHIISDACAQTIASWWHSPGSPLSTVLSTMGAVTSDMSIRDFVTQDQFDLAELLDRDALKALDAYIVEKQKVRN